MTRGAGGGAPQRSALDTAMSHLRRPVIWRRPFAAGPRSAPHANVWRGQSTRASVRKQITHFRAGTPPEFFHFPPCPPSAEQHLKFVSPVARGQQCRPFPGVGPLCRGTQTSAYTRGYPPAYGLQFDAPPPPPEVQWYLQPSCLYGTPRPSAGRQSVMVGSRGPVVEGHHSLTSCFTNLPTVTRYNCLISPILWPEPSILKSGT